MRTAVGVVAVFVAAVMAGVVAYALHRVVGPAAMLLGPAVGGIAGIELGRWLGRHEF